jgi:copper homeostasis protein
MEGGAKRLELCSALSEGGLTPTRGFVKQVKKIVAGRMQLHVLIRPRGGDFIYSEAGNKTLF